MILVPDSSKDNDTTDNFNFLPIHTKASVQFIYEKTSIHPHSSLLYSFMCIIHPPSTFFQNNSIIIWLVFVG